jgi:hypothetical protein
MEASQHHEKAAHYLQPPMAPASPSGYCGINCMQTPCFEISFGLLFPQIHKSNSVTNNRMHTSQPHRVFFSPSFVSLSMQTQPVSLITFSIIFVTLTLVVSLLKTY